MSANGCIQGARRSMRTRSAKHPSRTAPPRNPSAAYPSRVAAARAASAGTAAASFIDCFCRQEYRYISRNTDAALLLAVPSVPIAGRSPAESIPYTGATPEASFRLLPPLMTGVTPLWRSSAMSSRSQ